MMILCRYCDQPIDPNKAFCKYCGHEVCGEGAAPVTNLNAKYCPKCNMPVRDESIFCAYCGSPIPEGGPTRPPKPYEAPPTPRSKMPLVIGVSAGVVLIGVFFLWQFLSQANERTTAAEEALAAAMYQQPQAQEVPPQAQAPEVTPQVIVITVTPPPTYDSDVSTSVQDFAGVNNAPAAYDSWDAVTDIESFILQGDDRDYDYSELYQYSQDDVALIRNGMYALSGKIFSKKVNQNYFGNKQWYTPISEDDDYIVTRFNKHQRNNVVLIRQFEKDMGWK